MTDEFTESREKELDAQGLGDLPEDTSLLRNESGSDHQEPEFIPPGASITQGRTAGGVPLDIQREARISERPGEVGTVTLPYGVTTTYDGRHINARDFLVTSRVSFNVDSEATSASVTASYTKPGGYIGVWRQFSVEPCVVASFSYSSQQAGEQFSNILYTLLVNGTVVPEFEDMALGQVVNMFDLQTWVLGLENQTFEVKITYLDTALYDVAVGFDNDYFFNVGFYGQSLLVRGLPLPFEIASQTETGSVAT